MPTKLDAGQKHFLNLILKGADAEGWTKVSKAVMPLMLKMPFKLVEVESAGEDGNGRARLTDEGHAVLSAMAWV